MFLKNLLYQVGNALYINNVITPGVPLLAAPPGTLVNATGALFNTTPGVYANHWVVWGELSGEPGLGSVVILDGVGGVVGGIPFPLPGQVVAGGLSRGAQWLPDGSGRLVTAGTVDDIAAYLWLVNTDFSLELIPVLPPNGLGFESDAGSRTTSGVALPSWRYGA